MINSRSSMRLLARRNATCDPSSNLALNPTEGAIGQAHAAGELLRTFQTLSLGA
jgi:hypothetical protein